MSDRGVHRFGFSMGRLDVFGPVELYVDLGFTFFSALVLQDLVRFLLSERRDARLVRVAPGPRWERGSTGSRADGAPSSPTPGFQVFSLGAGKVHGGKIASVFPGDVPLRPVGESLVHPTEEGGPTSGTWSTAPPCSSTPRG